MSSRFSSVDQNPFKSILSRLTRLLDKSWMAVVIVIALLIAAPILSILTGIFADATDIWQHLAETVLADYIINSLLLMIGVGIGVTLFGVSTAWLVTLCRFPGDRFFQWGLLLPLAAPAYLLAYTYTNMLDYFGPVQIFLRSLFGWETINDYWFPNIRSLWGAMVMLILVLYPYVYLLARTSFLSQSVCTLEASRSLGCTPWTSFFKIALPLARPAIIAGLSLALMETLNDFGTVQYFGVNTFTTGIYNTWFGFGDLTAAIQLAAVLMVFIVSLIVLELISRRQARYYQNTSQYQVINPYSLQGIRGIGAFLLCLILVGLGFILPAMYLTYLTILNLESNLQSNFIELATHSLILAVISAALAVLISLVMAYGKRLYPNWGMNWGVRIAALGYAIPGSVIAVGAYIEMGRLDAIVDTWFNNTFGISTGLLFSGTIIALIYAYLVRFLAVAFGAVETSLGKIKPSLDDASRSLGNTPLNTLVKVHTPLMTGGMLTAMMLVFVDVMKELPATLLIRPFNFDTLAIRVFQYASDERLVEAAAPALAIVLVGIIPVIFLSRQIAKTRSQNS
ncbi:MAG: ABC transporter permease [Microcystaceae cyanobacterium]